MSSNQYQAINNYLQGVKPLRVRGKDVDWKEHWGKSGVFGKSLVSKANGVPFSVTLKKFPKQDEIVREGGYVVHAHPTLEIGYVIKGRMNKFAFCIKSIFKVGPGEFPPYPKALHIPPAIGPDVRDEFISSNGRTDPMNFRSALGGGLEDGGRDVPKILERIKGLRD